MDRGDVAGGVDGFVRFSGPIAAAVTGTSYRGEVPQGLRATDARFGVPGVDDDQNRSGGR